MKAVTIIAAVVAAGCASATPRLPWPRWSPPLPGCPDGAFLRGDIAQKQWCEDGDGALHGRATRYYSDGKAMQEQQYDRNRLHGLETVWFPHGNKSWERVHVHDRLVSVVEWRKDGSVLLRVAIEDGPPGPRVPSGPFVRRGRGDCGSVPRDLDPPLFPWPNEVFERRATGGWERFHPNGAPAQRGRFEGGVPEGDVEERHPGGARAAVCTFSRGVVQQTTRWSAGGRIIEQGTYAGGVHHGPWKHSAGSSGVVETGVYEHGRRAGEWTTLDASDSVLVRARWVDGKKHGPWRRWGRGGKPREEGRYAQDQPVGQWSFWHPNGELEARGELAGEIPYGEWGCGDARTSGMAIWRGPDLRCQDLMHIGYRGGRRVGHWETWFDNGQPRSAGGYVDGVKQGLWKEWGAGTKGRPTVMGRKYEVYERAEGTYVDGKRDGRWSWWIGKHKRVEEFKDDEIVRVLQDETKDGGRLQY